MPYADYLFRKKSGIFYFRKQYQSKLFCFSLNTRYYRIAKQKAALYLANILNTGDTGVIDPMSDIPIYYDPRLECWVLPDDQKIKWVKDNISGELDGDESNEELIALFDAFTAMKKNKIKLGAVEKARKFYNMPAPQPAESQSPPQTSQISRAGISLTEIIDKYLEDLKRSKNRRSEATIEEYRGKCRHFPFIMGDKDIVVYSKDDLKHFQDVIQKLPPKFTSAKAYRGKTYQQILKMKYERPLAVETVNSHIRLIKSVFGWAKNNDYIDKDPTEILEYDVEAKSKEKSRIPFTHEHIQKMIDAYPSEFESDRLKNRPERFWVPLIAIFSGMRLNEICQLRIEDVIQDHSGHWFYNVIEDDGFTRVKTKAGIREVPIHPALLELGFLDFFDRIKNNHTKRLWYKLNQDKKGKYSRSVGNWFNGSSGFNRRMITDDERITFHSTRHTLRNELKQLRIDNGIAAEIVGHEYEDGEAKTYTESFSIEVKYNELKKVTYGLDLSSLKYIADSYI